MKIFEFCPECLDPTSYDDYDDEYYCEYCGWHELEFDDDLGDTSYYTMRELFGEDQ